MPVRFPGLDRTSLRKAFTREGVPAIEIERGVALGLFVGFTPTLGAQFPILLALRALLPRRLRFDLPVSFLCTLPTNAFTIPFVYYVYVVTGRVVLGRFDRLRGFEVYSDRFENTVAAEGSWFERLVADGLALIEQFGLPLVVGSLPWAVAISALGWLLARRWLCERDPPAPA